jgi:hypothetical protein
MPLAFPAFITEFLCIASFFAFLRGLTGHFFAFFTPLSAFARQAEILTEFTYGDYFHVFATVIRRRLTPPPRSFASHGS